ncbi:hypothetical protein ACQPXB_01575 [Amycolatopsis sp. CA-161197]|uniref:hypothetical protein n=1 Tax=Amycolatopsis sp. CA-161197 TaxID=3239922 RepID=UPI003D924773
MAQPASEQNWLTGLDFAITDAPAAGGASSGGAPPSSGAPGGGRFSLSREEAQSMLVVAKRVATTLRTMQNDAERLTQVSPPADDPGSNGYNKQLVATGQGAFSVGKTQVDKEFKYASDLVTKLENALGMTGSADEQAAAGVKTAAGGSQDKGLA